MKKLIKVTLLVLTIAATGLPASFSTAAPITIVDAYHFLDNRADNSVGIVTGLRQQFGAVSVTPNGANGTSGVATQGNVTRTLNFEPLSVSPNFFARSISSNPNLTGSWDLTFTNGTDTALVTTPTIAGAQVVPFVNNVAISGSGAAPTFTWNVPNTFAPDSVRIQIFDTTDIFVGSGGAGGGGIADIIYNKFFPGSTTSFTVDPNDPKLTETLLQGRTYSFEINLLDTRDDLPHGSVANVLSGSRSFFDFSLLPGNAPPNVFLPTLIPGANPYYSFNIPVGGQMVFIDPFVAIGYDYQIGVGDPNFTSVLLPTGVGDDYFDLWLWDGAKFIDSGQDLKGGEKYEFGGLGVDRFRILGIETSAGLDPNNVTAFITGLEFFSSGQFTGTMTPLTAPVPEPTTLLLFGAGIAVLAAVGRRKRS